MFFFLFAVLTLGAGIALTVAILGIAAYDLFGWSIGMLIFFFAWWLAGVWNKRSKRAYLIRHSQDHLKVRNPAEKAYFDVRRQELWGETPERAPRKTSWTMDEIADLDHDDDPF